MANDVPYGGGECLECRDDSFAKFGVTREAINALGSEANMDHVFLCFAACHSLPLLLHQVDDHLVPGLEGDFDAFRERPLPDGERER